MKSELRKTLGLTDVFCISTGAMISSGIFILPGVAFSSCGPAVFLAYLLAGVCALIGTLATIELATAMPLSGGIYFYTGRSLGPLAGTVSGLLNWSAIALKSSFAIFGMSEMMYQFFNINPIVCGIALTLIFIILNLIGTKEAAWGQIIMVFLLLGAMGAYILLGLPELKPSRFTPLFLPDKSMMSLLAEAAFVFVAFGGLLDVASVSEEIKNPRRNLPWGMISAIIAVMLIYMLTLIVTVGVMEPKDLSGSLTPLADAAQQYYGSAGFWVISIGAMMAFVTTANAGVMAAARFPFAMGRDKLIPAFFSRTYGNKKMPLPALLITGGMMVGAQLLPLEQLVTVASTVIMLSFILTNLAVIILRESEIQNYRPSFKIPWYPITPLVSIGLFALLIMELGLGSVQISVGIIIAGVILYFMFGRKVNLEYALTHLFHRMLKRAPKHHGLEYELREIIRERDNIVVDKFDRIVDSADAFIDDRSTTFEALAQNVCENIDTPQDTPSVIRALILREHQSSTVLTDTVAIPHITIEGENYFKLVIVKSPDGIPFNERYSSVKTILFLLGSADKRNLHLKILAGIAQIIQDPMFEENWQKARTPEQLKDLLLLSKRKRV